MPTRDQNGRKATMRLLRRSDGTRRDLTPVVLWGLAACLALLAVVFLLRDPAGDGSPGLTAAPSSPAAASAAPADVPACGPGMVGKGVTCRTKLALLTYHRSGAPTVVGAARLEVVGATTAQLPDRREVRVDVRAQGREVRGAFSGASRRLYLAVSGRRIYPSATTAQAGGTTAVRFPVSRGTLANPSLCFVRSQRVGERRRVDVMPLSLG